MNTTPNIASHLLRSRIGKICIAITGQSAEEMVDKAAAALKDTTFIEFRLDYLPKPATALPPPSRKQIFRPPLPAAPKSPIPLRSSVPLYAIASQP